MKSVARQHLSLAWLSALLVAGLLCADGAAAQSGPPAATTSGTDILHPLRRIDLRSELESESDEETLTFTLRYNQPVLVGEHWQLNLRADLPFRSVETEEDDNWTGIGVGDTLLHAVLVRKLGEDHGFGFGAQLIMPTAGKKEYGRDQWRLRPIAAYRWPVSSISDGTFFQLLVRYDLSIAGDDDRPKTSELQLSPNLEIALPGDAYFSIFPSPDIRYNFTRDEFFFPANLEVGKQLGRLVLSVEVGKALIKDDHPPYDWRFETRLGLKF